MTGATTTHDESLSAHAAKDDAAYPSSAYAIYVIGVLMLVTLNSLLDRYLPSLLIGPIRETLQITDTEISLIQGYAFALFFVLLSVPFGRLVDRTNRRNLIVFGLVVWSATTILCGFANDMWSLFLGRVGVGIGEACLQPAAYSLIADYVRPKYRGRALGLYFMSLTIGAGASMILGATVLHLLPKTPMLIPGIGAFEPWQMVFVIAGLSGFIALPLLATVREPPRRDHSGATIDASKTKTTFKAFLAYVAANPKAFACTYICYVALSFSGLCIISWAPTFFARRYDIPLSSVGVLIGISMIVGAIIGSLTGGFLSDRWLSQGRTGARLRVALLALCILIPAALLWTTVDGLYLSLAIFCVVAAVTTMGTGSSSTTIQDLVPNSMRGQAVAIYVLFSGLLALGLGPSAVALVTDYVFGQDEMLGYSIVLVSVPSAILALIVGILGLGAYHRTQAALAERKDL